MASFPVFEDVQLTGRRVLLRPVHPSDAGRAFELIDGQAEILRWLIWQGPSDVAELRGHYGDWIQNGSDGCDYRFAVIERETGAWVGSISARMRDRPVTGDIGYWLGRPYWGRGYGSEAVRLLAWFCFECLRASSLCAWVFVGNEGSRKVLERTGFSLTHTSRERRVRPDLVVDEWYFSLLASDWSERFSGYAPRSTDVRAAKPRSSRARRDEAAD